MLEEQRQEVWVQTCKCIRASALGSRHMASKKHRIRLKKPHQLHL